MSQQYPQQPPGWGQQPTQPGYGHPQQPGWGAPPPQPPKRNVGKILGIIGAVLVSLIVIGAIAGGGEDSNNDASTTPSSNSPAVAKDDAAAPAAEEETAEPAPEAPVKITAKKTTFAKSILAQDNTYTSVKVTITNNSDETISVNPLYFEITDTDGTKHSQELAADENQIDTVKLAPGENVSGAITGKGKFTPKTVTYTDGFFADPIRVNVS